MHVTGEKLLRYVYMHSYFLGGIRTFREMTEVFRVGYMRTVLLTRSDQESQCRAKKDVRIDADIAVPDSTCSSTQSDLRGTLSANKSERPIASPSVFILNNHPS